MHEFDSVSVSSFEASSLAARLTEKSRDGWEVVAIVPAGSDIVAYLKKGAAGAAASTETGTTADTGDTSAVSEPAGWASAPASSTTGGSGWESSQTGETAGAAPGSGGATWGGSAGTERGGTWGGSAGGTQDAGSGWGAGGGQTQPAQTTQQQQPAVPAGWYTDPSGRYELRYWDGNAWTEHVSRAGQQYTDPPVA